MLEFKYLEEVHIITSVIKFRYKITSNLGFVSF